MSKVTQYRKPSSFEQYAEEFRNAIAGKRELTAFLRKKNFDNLDSKDTVTVYTLSLIHILITVMTLKMCGLMANL